MTLEDQHNGTYNGVLPTELLEGTYATLKPGGFLCVETAHTTIQDEEKSLPNREDFLSLGRSTGFISTSIVFNIEKPPEGTTDEDYYEEQQVVYVFYKPEAANSQRLAANSHVNRETRTLNPAE